MNALAPLTCAADPARVMPASSGARLDAAEAALTSLHGEQRRLERLGFELPLARCHQQIRFWGFVRALCALESEGRS
ncbi:MAG TPA: hypothetical protein VMH61_08750 [Candidatus Acidoferrales bacterium]|nr:hypothetical protein [Candidatus Acidoferrales bacterium]